MNPKLVRAKDHGDFDPKDLYHERVKILNRLKTHMWKNNQVEMKAQIVVDVVPFLVALAPNLFHHNNVGVTYVGISNFKVEPLRFVPLYFLAVLHSVVTITKAPFITTLAHTILV